MNEKLKEMQLAMTDVQAKLATPTETVGQVNANNNAGPLRKTQTLKDDIVGLSISTPLLDLFTVLPRQRTFGTQLEVKLDMPTNIDEAGNPIPITTLQELMCCEESNFTSFRWTTPLAKICKSYSVSAEDLQLRKNQVLLERRAEDSIDVDYTNRIVRIPTLQAVRTVESLLWKGDNTVLSQNSGSGRMAIIGLRTQLEKICNTSSSVLTGAENFNYNKVEYQVGDTGEANFWDSVTQRIQALEEKSLSKFLLIVPRGKKTKMIASFNDYMSINGLNRQFIVSSQAEANSFNTMVNDTLNNTEYALTDNLSIKEVTGVETKTCMLVPKYINGTYAFQEYYFMENRQGIINGYRATSKDILVGTGFNTDQVDFAYGNECDKVVFEAKWEGAFVCMSIPWACLYTDVEFLETTGVFNNALDTTAQVSTVLNA
jgi:hypothetical protein